ncbi:MAG: carboxypeptidase regulatory-like domain-containing protein [Candidatus Scalindua sp.]
MYNVLFAFLLIVSLIMTFSTIPAYSAEVTNEGNGVIKGKINVKAKKYKKDTVVYIERVKGNFPPHGENAIMDQKNLVFIPHVLVVLKGTTVDYLNSDDVRHNVFSPDAIADKMNLGMWPRGEVRPYTFNKLGDAVMLCNVHPEMEAYVVVVQNPYFSKTDKEGNYEIENVPPGEYTLKVWNKKYKAKDKKITIKSGEALTVDFKLKR